LSEIFFINFTKIQSNAHYFPNISRHIFSMLVGWTRIFIVRRPLNKTAKKKLKTKFVYKMIIIDCKFYRHAQCTPKHALNMFKFFNLKPLASYCFVRANYDGKTGTLLFARTTVTNNSNNNNNNNNNNDEQNKMTCKTIK